MNSCARLLLLDTEDSSFILTEHRHRHPFVVHPSRAHFNTYDHDCARTTRGSLETLLKHVALLPEVFFRLTLRIAVRLQTT